VSSVVVAKLNYQLKAGTISHDGAGGERALA
jgi:hypothetical protein